MTNAITIDADGGVRAIWSDSLSWLRDEGECQIRRASHVEPTPESRWTADMRPSGGLILGDYDLRQDALAAELEWLAANLGLWS